MDSPHPCHGRTLAMQRCFDAIATTGRPIGRGATLATLLLHKLVRPAGWLTVHPGPTQIGVRLYEPELYAMEEWKQWKASGEVGRVPGGDYRTDAGS